MLKSEALSNPDCSSQKLTPSRRYQIPKLEVVCALTVRSTVTAILCAERPGEFDALEDVYNALVRDHSVSVVLGVLQFGQCQILGRSETFGTQIPLN
ncbi:hypothetical protein C5167_014384 [Papaver somniferum]|uniref:Uncharacterized protein n=1 Tax=Papaver somniferum TaxID=3469 RepID=A0A4Y7J308_PAPSO|nr:hypothetical protein C5167_014384 [Papaver somniferum]